MVILTVLAVWALGSVFAPATTRVVVRTCGSILGSLAMLAFVLWRIAPKSSHPIRRR